jgi:hypothetical protein
MLSKPHILLVYELAQQLRTSNGDKKLSLAVGEFKIFLTGKFFDSI